MWIDRKIVESLMSDKDRLVAEFQEARHAHAEEVQRLKNDNALLTSANTVLNQELNRLKRIANNSSPQALLQRYGLTEEEGRLVDWQRMGYKPPEG